MVSTNAHVKICPVCGAESSKVQFIGPFCIEHVPISPKFPESIEVQECGRCGKVMLGNKWVPNDREKILEFALAKLSGAGEQVTYDLDSGYATAMIPFQGSLVQVQKHVPVILKKSICTECSRKSGGAFQAIIQFRGENRNLLKKTADKVAGYLAEKSFVCKEEELKEGFDVYAGERAKAIEALNAFALGYVRTEKLHGQTKEGKRLYRTTLLVRIGRQKRDDRVKFQE
ncbi:MAG: NMD3-related protein [Candidatus Micrarchaeia archaeon]